jgi:hypothetical protein
LLGPRLAAALTLAIGLVASHLLNHVEKLPPPVVDLRALFFSVISPAIVGTLVVNGSAIPARLWMMLWHWLHASKDSPSCGTLLATGALDWAGCIIVSVALAFLVGRKATFAAMVGVTVYLCLELTDTFTHDLSRETLGVLTSSCSWLRPDETPDYDSFRFGFMTGLVARALVIIFTTRWASKFAPGEFPTAF